MIKNEESYFELFYKLLYKIEQMECCMYYKTNLNGMINPGGLMSPICVGALFGQVSLELVTHICCMDDCRCVLTINLKKVSPAVLLVKMAPLEEQTIFKYSCSAFFLCSWKLCSNLFLGFSILAKQSV